MGVAYGKLWFVVFYLAGRIQRSLKRAPNSIDINASEVISLRPRLL